ncbi:L-glutamate gamma-semialdehyde dehydrogenase [Aureibacillus halotolerans]|uniref:L-glutamate gamma-semialdehyde dehydrogenase n=1 Tax=Aureibacillus halotolerans TaxID=1508390 RepID=A0A4R6UCS1_9BACI|nr:L-glutamate gamma-semialdehyde dehydrogenase [Aureibacillus halotolerans]TDQ40884.1 delta-1-pyrroline-5-carboxylate dehydrogenase [Aureibacillus halotolerans]
MIPYRPEIFTDFAQEAHKVALTNALEEVRQALGKSYPLLLEGIPVMQEQTFSSINPSQKDEVIGHVSKATAEQARRAVDHAHEMFPAWAYTSVYDRAAVLFRAAAKMRRRKHEFSSWLMLEAGKTAAEADADTAEAIDFMEYYGRQMIALSETANAKLTPLPGELSELQYLPLGTAVVIPPWNFALAITVGMTTAALVAGNTVVLKPASATPVVAYHFAKLLEEAGLPKGVLQYVPGSGSEIGDVLVDHPHTRLISFTGSKDVGLRIFAKASVLQPGQKWLKRFIGELGGKDAIVVDQDADLEEAAVAIVGSAFSFSGQKCSACSRAIVHEAVYDEVLERCVALTEAFTVGHVEDIKVNTGPVIDEAAHQKILTYIDIGKQEGRLVAGGRKGSDAGYYIEPTIFADVDAKARIMQEEIFGPVLAFSKASSFDEALAIANDTDYGLTGAVFTRNGLHAKKARDVFHVGNLYINRKCTGAIVGAHPFGGFNLSGTDSKAGGPDYLLQFTQPKLISEKL